MPIDDVSDSIDSLSGMIGMYYDAKFIESVFYNSQLPDREWVKDLEKEIQNVRH